MRNFVNDFLLGLRFMRRNMTFTLVALATLALGIGANTAIFSVVKAVLLEPLPFDEPDRLVRIWGKTPKLPRTTTSIPDYFDYREQSTVFEEIGHANPWTYTASGDGRPVVIRGGQVAAELFAVLGAEAQQGRLFTVEEDRPGGDAVVVIGDGLWRRMFAADPEVVGRTILLDGIDRQIVGVVEPGFSFPEGAEIWVPTAMDRHSFARNMNFLDIFARLKPGVDLAAAEADMAIVTANLEREFPESHTGRTVEIVPLIEETVGNVRAPLLVLMGASALVLLIACCNVANLLLVRSASRRGEVVLRAALGACRGRLMRQFFAESLLLALIGAALGVGLAKVGLGLLLALSPPDVPRLDEVAIDGWVLAFALGLAVVTAVGFSLVPILRLAPGKKGAEQGQRLGGDGRSSASVGGNAVVVAEVALAVALVIGAGLLVRSFAGLLAVDPGFKSENALKMDILLPPARYPSAVESAAFFDQLLERIEALPGVEIAGASWSLPFSPYRGSTKFFVEGRPMPPPSQEPRASFQPVTLGFFGALGIPLRRGRVFDRRDGPDSTPVLVINQAAAEQLWPGEDPIGQRVRFGLNYGDMGVIEEDVREIVGVVGNVKRGSLEGDLAPEIYIPHRQVCWRQMSLVVRSATDGDPDALAKLVNEQVWAVDSDQPVFAVAPLASILDGARSLSRFSMVLITLFAVLALILAAVGIFGVISYATARRRREIGVRVALGAVPTEVVGLVVRRGLTMTAVGLAIGLAAAVGMSIAFESYFADLLFQVSAIDPLTYVLVAVVMTAVASIASYLPARRAARVDPATVLRHE